VEAPTSDTGMMEKIFRGFLPKGSSDVICPLEAQIKAVTGESLCLHISAGTFSEVSPKIMNQLRQAQVDGLMKSSSLDHVVRHMHIKCGTLTPERRRDAEAQEDGSPALAAVVENVVADVPLRHSVSSPAASSGHSSMLLYRIPVAVLSCRRLTSLVIEDQQLLSLEDLLSCEQLEELRIINCELRDVPAQMLQKLPALHLLDLRCNLLSSVVMGGSAHDNMRTVCMSHNQIAALPQVLCRMPNLTELDVSFNRLSSLPSELRQLSYLTRLNVEGNALVTPSVALIRGVLGSIDVVTRFPRLVQLNLSRNKITELPHYIDYLSSLTELVVAENRITRVPVQLVTVANLALLDLSGNPLGSVMPSEITLLKSLSVLRVSSCKLASFPQGLSKLPHLKEFDVSRNGIRHIEKGEVMGLGSLTSLNISRNRLEDCEFLLELQSLVKLDISQNSIKVLPEEIHVLESLRSLNAGQNQLKGLPPSFGQLYNLEEVDLSNNSIDWLGSFWNSSSFPRLRVLLLEGNNPRLVSSLQFAFSTLLTLQSLSMLGVVVDENNLIIANPARFDLQLVIEVTITVRHPLLLAAFFGLVSRQEYREGLFFFFFFFFLCVCFCVFFLFSRDIFFSPRSYGWRWH
jgi:Leucine-rich repeat (LRR) protein